MIVRKSSKPMKVRDRATVKPEVGSGSPPSRLGLGKWLAIEGRSQDTSKLILFLALVFDMPSKQTARACSPASLDPGPSLEWHQGQVRAHLLCPGMQHRRSTEGPLAVQISEFASYRYACTACCNSVGHMVSVRMLSKRANKVPTRSLNFTWIIRWCKIILGRRRCSQPMSDRAGPCQAMSVVPDRERRQHVQA